MGFRWCPECRRQVRVVPEPICQTCGMPLSHPGLCSTCRDCLPPYKEMRSWLVFEGPIRHAIHSLKYRRNVALGDALAQHFAEYVGRLDWLLDVIVAVPLGRQRMAERGYNQVTLVARPLAAIMGKCYSSQILTRARETRTQVGLSPAERKANVAGAFHADADQTSGKNILVVDDVATTGATTASCAESLQKAGAKNVYVLTLARALPQHGLQIV